MIEDFLGDFDRCADYDRSELIDDLEESTSVYDVDRAMDDYDDRKAEEFKRKYDEDLEYEDDEYDFPEEDLQINKEFTDKLNDPRTNIFGQIIGSNHPADLLGAGMALGEELASMPQQEAIEIEPISGKEHKEALSRDFSKIRKNVTPFETFVDAHIKGELQPYLFGLYNNLNNLYNDLFGAGISDFYHYLYSKKITPERLIESNLKFNHLKALKDVADIAIQTGEYNFERLISDIVDNKKINLKKELAS